MSTTNTARLRQRAQRLEIPDEPISTVAIQSVQAACHQFLKNRGMLYNWTSRSTRLGRRKLMANETKEVAARGAENQATLPTQSDSDGQTVSITVR